MLPEHAIRPDVDQGRLRPLPITDPQMRRNIALICRDGAHLDPEALDLVDCIEKAELEFRHSLAASNDNQRIPL
jgi:DNA-binding transcriptional LysR family regulator